MSPDYVLNLEGKKKKKIQFIFLICKEKEKISTYIAILNERQGNVEKLKYNNYVSTGNTDLLR